MKPPPRDHGPFILSTLAACHSGFRFPMKVSGSSCPTIHPTHHWRDGPKTSTTHLKAAALRQKCWKKIKAHGELSRIPPFFFIHFALCIVKKSSHSKNWRIDFWVFGSCPVFSFSQENFPTHEFTAHLSHLRPWFDQEKWPVEVIRQIPRYKYRHLPSQ